MKSVNVRREDDEDRRDRAERLHAFDEVPARDLLNKFLEEAKGQLFGNEVRHEKGSAFRFGDSVDRFGQLCFHFRFGEVAGKLFPKRHVGRLGQLEDFSREHALRDEARFLLERELGRIATFHETRKHLFEQRGARP